MGQRASLDETLLLGWTVGLGAGDSQAHRGAQDHRESRVSKASKATPVPLVPKDSQAHLASMAGRGHLA
jgi:hypothetical protein